MKPESEFVVTGAIYCVESIDKCGWDFVGGSVREILEPTKVHRGKLNERFGI